MDLRVICAVGVGAAVGGIFRLLITQLVVARAGAGYGFYATMFINISGSFLIGIVIQLAQSQPGMPLIWRYFLATGILGGYTTFSAFSLDAGLLYERGELGLAALYVLGSVVLSIIGLFAGLALIRGLVGAA